jgi:general secretion pathway protein G
MTTHHSIFSRITGFASPTFMANILITLTVLGILAALTLPQVTFACDSARTSSVTSTLRTLRSQVEMYKCQHGGLPPTATALAGALTSPNTGGDTAAAGVPGALGAYLNKFPANPLNGWSQVGSVAEAHVGWVYSVDGDAYTLRATNTTGTGLMPY